MIVEVSREIVSRSIAVLQKAGAMESERVLLWLGRRGQACIGVTEEFVPEQVASYDFFNIPPHAMQALMRHLRERSLMVAAQVHSHPQAAFHSKADDRWAIVRHEGALSIVVPDFASGTSVENFGAT